MGVKFANNAYGTLNASITNTDTSLTLSSGQGARFPSLGAGDYFYVTLIDTSNNLEIAKCTARSSDVLTITRGQEGTTARAYAVGDRVELRITAAGLDAVYDEAVADSASSLDGDKGDITVSSSGTVWTIDDNTIDAAALNVSGNGTSGQALLSDGDGSFSWGDGAKIIATHQATNSSRTGLSNTNSRVVFWNAMTFTKLRSNSKLRICMRLPFGASGVSYPHFAEGFIRLSTGGYSSNGSDIHGYIHNTRATSNDMGAIYTSDFVYDTTGTNISGTGTVYVSIGYHSASSGTLSPAPIWNPNAADQDRSWQSISNIVINEVL